jgi:hypothetical protein
VLRTAHAGDPSTYDEARRSLLDEADGKIREIVGWLSKVRDELKEAEEKEEGSSGMAGKGQYWAFARNMCVVLVFVGDGGCASVTADGAELRLVTDHQDYRSTSRVSRSCITCDLSP